MLKCAYCDEPFPKRAYLMLNFGARSYRCRNCGAISRLNTAGTIKWTVLPLAATLGVLYLAIELHSFLIAAIGYVLIRAIWMFLAPALIPLEIFMPRSDRVK